MDKEVLFTIGYQGLALNDFTEKLKENKIQTLIDIREIPLSRKKGFSKNTLKENINKEGIRYIHFKQLGSPRELRKKLYQDSDYEFFFKRFSEYLKTQHSSLNNLHKQIISEKCCLLCFEKDPALCHRSIVANEIKAINNNGLKIINL